jgi:hypothetical protein
MSAVDSERVDASAAAIEESSVVEHAPPLRVPRSAAAPVMRRKSRRARFDAAMTRRTSGMVSGRLD